MLSLEGAGQGVASNCVNPGYVRTPLVEKQIADQPAVHGLSEDEVITKALLTQSAIKRLIEPEEVAGTVPLLRGRGPRDRKQPGGRRRPVRTLEGPNLPDSPPLPGTRGRLAQP